MDRINKFLAKAGLGSRRNVEQMIDEGRVTINGKPAVLSSQVGENDIVRADGQIVSPQKFIYILMNKPRGVVTTLSDPHAEKKVTDYLPKEYEGVFPVGRLDKETTGLLVLTNDGDLAYKLTHPKFKKEKTYLIKAEPQPQPEALSRLEKGIELEDGPTQPAKIKTMGSQISITITEGRKRQVRRMFDAVGSKVIELKRIGFANITLQNLKEGEFRLLTSEEIEGLKK